MHLRGKVEAWWGELTDDDLDRMAGAWEQSIGRLQERYGYTRARAEAEVNRLLREDDGAPR